MVRGGAGQCWRYRLALQVGCSADESCIGVWQGGDEDVDAKSPSSLARLLYSFAPLIVLQSTLPGSARKNPPLNALVCYIFSPSRALRSVQRSWHALGRARLGRLDPSKAARV